MLHRQPLIAARVVDQPNRFTVRVTLQGQHTHPATAEPVGSSPNGTRLGGVFDSETGVSPVK